ncbi:MAG TPA: hypothetical protein VIR54_22945 [Vicinamibacterales bacterium]
MFRRLLTPASITALISTAAVGAYYRHAPIGIIPHVRGLLVWFDGALWVSTGSAWLGYWLAMRTSRTAPHALRLALVLMVAATVSMLLVEWATTRPDRAYPRIAHGGASLAPKIVPIDHVSAICCLSLHS